MPGDALDLRELPLLVAEGADAPRLQPALDAVQMEDVAAAAEGDREAVLVVGRSGSPGTRSLGSLSEFLQMAQVSAQMSQDHMQTCARRWRLSWRVSAGGSRSPERRARDGGGASLVEAQRAAFGVLSTRLLSKTLRARRGHRVIQHSMLRDDLPQIAAAADRPSFPPRPGHRWCPWRTFLAVSDARARAPARDLARRARRLGGTKAPYVCAVHSSTASMR